MERAQEQTEESRQQEHAHVYEKLTFVYLSLPYLLLGHLLGALLLSTLMLNGVDLYLNGIWLILNVVVIVYRIYHYRLYRQATEEEKHEKGHLYLDRYYTDVLASGLVWGSAAFLIFPAANVINQVIVLLFLIAIGFSSMGMLASRKTLHLLYAALIFLPIIVRLFLMEASVYRAIAFAGLALVLLMILAANYYGAIINKSLLDQKKYIDGRISCQKLDEQFFSIFERAPIGVFHFNESLIIEDANPRFLKMLGLQTKQSVVGKDLREIWPDKTVLNLHERVLRGFGGEHQDQLSATAFGNQTVHVNLSSAPLHDDHHNVIGGITIINDITPQIQAEEELVRFMNYDTLTSLPNRTLLLKHIKMAVDAKLRTGIFGALLFLDVNHFNNINRTYGQKTGDSVLRKIAAQLQETTAERGTVARIGADTFAILMPVLTEDREESKEHILAFILELRKAFERVMIVGEAEYHISFTIGVALFDTNIETPLDILRHAESTMFGAKHGARGTVRFYEKDLEGMALNDMAIANDIYKAIKNNELQVFYQPQQDIHSGILTGAEALVRWNHPRRGSVSPAHFIPIAEESGAIIKLEEWIFEQIFKDMRTMADTLIEFPLNYIAVNVSSPHFLQPNFVEKFTSLVHKYRINPLWINIEITESGIMSNIDEAISRIQELKRQGFGFSIDDFGTGYSSLTYLKSLPVDIIKIDRSFVKDADRNEGDRLIVESVIEISRKFGFKVLAEGIDRQETLDYFKTTACKTFQGYLYYKPISMNQFIQLI
jgi:diguanylate cyclase (GGDEF)-like protein/PAS domain S-box-containing protein